MKSVIITCMTLLLLLGCSDNSSSPEGKTKTDFLLLKNAHFPSWSPDGMGLVCNRSLPEFEYCVWWITINGTISDTLLLDTNGYGPWYPKWMPDGQRVVYHRTRSDGVDPVYEFVIQDLQGSNPIVWNVPAFWHDAAFTLVSDGSELLYSTRKDTSWALSLSDGSVRFISDGYGASASPDGQWLAFTKNDSITVTPFGGGLAITFEPGWDPAWTPDSKYIIFSGFGKSASPDLIIVSTDGSYRAQLTDDPEWDLRPEVSPNGDRLAYVKTADDDYGPFNIRIIDLSRLGLGM
ncbi:MAG: hypothetical protein ABIA59_03165 [Candidatus Latescibacterota bacterium]